MRQLLKRLSGDLLFACGALLIVFLARAALDPWLAASLVYPPVIFAVAAAAYWRGIAAALAALAIGLVAAHFFFVEPRLQFGPTSFEEGMSIGLIAALGIVIGVLGSRRSLRRKSDELAALMDLLPVALFIAHDESVTRLTRNRAASRLFQLPLDEPSQRNHYGPSGRYRLWRPDTDDEVPYADLPLQRAARGETLAGEEYRATLADGGSRTVLVSAAPIRDGDGAITGSVAAFNDLTAYRETENALRAAHARIEHLNAELQHRVSELEHAEAALLDADRRKDEFLALLAHELRNPLAPVQNAVQILAARNAPREATVNAVAIVERQVRHMSRLIDDLLDISRITRGKINLRKEPISLARVLAEAIETSRPVIEAASHRLHVDLGDDPFSVDGDRTRLAQVFLNLLSNAAKYTPRGGDITVRARGEGEAVVVTVRDTGIGIAAEKLARVFEPFWQVDPSVTRAAGGLGIGLTLVERLVKLHGGTVTAASEGADRGSEFTVRLPLARAQAPIRITVTAQGGAGHAPAIAPARRGGRVLIADDNDDALDSLATLLALRGHEVVGKASDGAQALELASRTLPQVMLLDIGMPIMDGYEAARRVRRAAWGKDVVLVAVTGWGQASDIARARRAGFDHHLTKPVSADELDRILGASVTAMS